MQINNPSVPGPTYVEAFMQTFEQRTTDTVLSPARDFQNMALDVGWWQFDMWLEIGEISGGMKLSPEFDTAPNAGLGWWELIDTTEAHLENQMSNLWWTVNWNTPPAEMGSSPFLWKCHGECEIDNAAVFRLDWAQSVASGATTMWPGSYCRWRRLGDRA